MKRKSVFLVAIAAVFFMVTLASGFAAGSKEKPAAGAAAAKELNVSVLVWKYSDTYGSSVRAAMESWAAKLGAEKGIKVTLKMVDGNDDQAIQNDQAVTLLEKKPDILVINLCQVTAGQHLVDLAKAKGVPVLFYNKEPSEASVVTGAQSMFIGTKAEQAGEMQGDILAKLWKDNPAFDKNKDGKVQYLMFKGDADNIEAIARTEFSVSRSKALGLNMELANGQIIVANWDTAKAQDAMQAVWAKYGDKIEVIFCNNDDMALGVIAALNGVGYNMGTKESKFIPIIGVDASNAAVQSIADGKLAGTVKQDGDAMGKAIIELAMNGAQKKGWLDGTSYKLSDDGFSIRIPYSPITK